MAEAIGFHFVDREIVQEAALHLGLDPEVASSRDERVPDIVEEVGLALAASTPGFGPEFGMPPVAEVDGRALAEATSRVIHALADAGGYVILGRGAQCILAGRADVLHASLVGTPDDRARRISEWQHIDEHTARHRCRDLDGERAAYVKRYYGRDIRDPLLYDLVLNTSLLSLTDATDLIVAAARRKLAA